MALTGFDTHETVKDLEASGFSEAQAEAIARGLLKAQNIDLSNFATKTDLRMEIAELRAEMRTGFAELRAELIKWVVGIAFAQTATIVAVLKLSSH